MGNVYLKYSTIKILSLLILASMGQFVFAADEPNPLLRPLSTECTTMYVQISDDTGAEQPFIDKLTEEGDIRGIYASNNFAIAEKEKKALAHLAELEGLYKENHKILKQLKAGAKALGIRYPVFDKRGFLVEGKVKDPRKLPPELFTANPDLKLTFRDSEGLEDGYWETGSQRIKDWIGSGVKISLGEEKSAEFQLGGKISHEDARLDMDIEPGQRVSFTHKSGKLRLKLEYWGRSASSPQLEWHGLSLHRVFFLIRDPKTKEVLSTGLLNRGRATFPLETVPSEFELVIGSKSETDG